MTLQSLAVAGAELNDDEVDGFEDDWRGDWVGYLPVSVS